MAETILVVEDSVTVRTVTRWVAESAGLRVLEAASLQEASDLLSTESPSTILLDYHLPDGAGVDFCRNIRANSDFDSVRVILVHGEAHPFDPADASAAGATGTLKKPFRSQTLLDVLSGQVDEPIAAAPAEQVTEQAPAAPPEPPTPPSMEDAMRQASEKEEAGAAATPSGMPAPPQTASAASRLPRPRQSGLSKLPPMPGSGVHRLPPPGGQPVTVAGRGTTPRSPTGAHRAITDDLVESTARRMTSNGSQPALPIEAVEEKQPAAAPAPSAYEADTGPVQTISARRNQDTAEVNVLDEREIRDEHAARPEEPQAPEAKTAIYQVTEEQLRGLVEERTKAIVEEVLPQIARQALAQLLRTELNEQIVRLGVTRRVSQFLDNDLPNYAQQAIDRRLKQTEGS